MVAVCVGLWVCDVVTRGGLVEGRGESMGVRGKWIYEDSSRGVSHAFG